jgi:hypothetical protein
MLLVSVQVCVECVGYLLEELRSPETLEQLRKDVSEADIFIGSLIFIQELAEKVRSRSSRSHVGPVHNFALCVDESIGRHELEGEG